MNKRDETRKKWEQIVRRHEQSGMSQAGFAAAHKVGEPALRYWIYKLRAEKARAASPAAPMRFVPVEVAGTPKAGAIELRLGDVAIMLPEGTTAAYVAELAAALRRVPC